MTVDGYINGIPVIFKTVSCSPKWKFSTEEQQMKKFRRDLTQRLEQLNAGLLSAAKLVPITNDVDALAYAAFDFVKAVEAAPRRAAEVDEALYELRQVIVGLPSNKLRVLEEILSQCSRGA